jgi:hypothetical protein
MSTIQHAASIPPAEPIVNLGSPPPSDPVRARHTASPRAEAVLNGAICAALLFVPALVCFFRNVVDDPDVWWHLKTGEWILGHLAWPTADPFSTSGAGQPWTAYSWLAEIVLYGLYQALGLRGLVLFTAGISAAIVAAFYGLVRRMGANRLASIVFTLAAALGLISLQTPRPWLASVLFFVLELDLLLTAGRTGKRLPLLWLVPLFLLWANVHVQFVVGLAVLGLAVAEPLLARTVLAPFSDDDSRRMPFAWMLLVFTMCAAATLVNPYGYHLYEVALQLLGQSGLWNLIQELGAMRFRSVESWTVLAVTLAAAFAMGWQRRVRLLLAMLFVVAVFLSFRSRRDVWLVLLVGLAVLAYVGPKAAGFQAHASRRWKWAVAGAVAAGTIAGSLVLSGSRLQRQVDADLPAGAARFLAREHLSGPMFNPFGWGGYLIFHLPDVPVSIDGRTMVHGEERILRHSRTLRGEEGWQDDPELAAARLVVSQRNAALTSLLRLDGRFRPIYEDPVAVVFVRNGGLSQ